MNTGFNKKFILIFLLLLIGIKANPTTEQKQGKVVEYIDRNASIVKIHNCEYIKSYTGEGYVYTHRGDCPYCVAREDKMLNAQERLIKAISCK